MIDDLLQSPLATTIDYYARCVDEKAKAFLAKHSLCARAALRVGMADRSFGKQFPTTRCKTGHQVREHLKQAGILKPNGRELFRGHVTVPLSDPDSCNDITGIYGLRIDPSQGDKESTLGSGIFNAAALKTFSEIILCTDILDAWTFCAAGYDNAVCGVGIKWTPEHFENVKRVLLATAQIDTAPLQSIELLRLHFPEGVSVNQYAIQNTGQDDPLGKRIRAASWISGAPQEAQRSETGSRQPVASPQPQPIDDLSVDQNETEVTMRIENRRWRIRGLDRNTTVGVLKVNLMVFHQRTERFHVDTLDLYHARTRRVFLKEAMEETGSGEHELRSDLGRVLLKLEQLQHEQRAQDKTPNAEVELTDTERAEALELLEDEKLLDRILDDFETCGIVGEHAGKLAGYLAATSRLLDRPLGLIIQSSSAAGKSALADSVLRLMPPEQRLACSAMTSQSLYYLGKENLRHKILSVAEEEGVRDASYQLKLLQSEGHLSLVATSKETGTGRTATERYDVQGPVALVMTTTSLSVDPELMNRCLVVNVDESVSQTEAILQQQRFAETIEGWEQALRGKSIVKRHQNAQRLLRRLPVFNPYAEQLGFIGSQTRHRRDHQKYLSLIKAVTLLYQYQHELKSTTVDGKTVQYIEVTRADIAKANTIADWALGRSIDELAGPTRRLLVELYDWVRATARVRKLDPSEVLFTRRDARESLGWTTTYMARHLERLCHAEYVVRCSGGVGKLCKYSLLYDGRGREGQAAILGLVDASSLVMPNVTPTRTDLTQ